MLAKTCCMKLYRVNSLSLNAYFDTSTYYEIGFDEGRLVITSLHAFSGIRDGVTMLLDAKTIKKNDLIWIDKATCISNGSFRKGIK
jgi:hypothetical protein